MAVTKRSNYYAGKDSQPAFRQCFHGCAPFARAAVRRLSCPVRPPAVGIGCSPEYLCSAGSLVTWVDKGSVCWIVPVYLSACWLVAHNLEGRHTSQPRLLVYRPRLCAGSRASRDHSSPQTAARRPSYLEGRRQS